jgi:deoxyribonuclease V
MQNNLETLIEKQNMGSSLVNEKNSFTNAKVLLVTATKQINKSIFAIGLLYDLNTNTHKEHWVSGPFPVSQKYLPGLLSLRRKKPVIASINHYEKKFDVVMIEGAGRQHPRKYGLACEIGVEENIPVLGIVKHSLWGEIDYRDFTVFSDYKSFPVYDGDDKIAYFVRKNNNKRGIFISVGNNISLDSALKIIIPILIYRIPEPLRLIKTLLKEIMK